MPPEDTSVEMSLKGPNNEEKTQIDAIECVAIASPARDSNTDTVWFPVRRSPDLQLEKYEDHDPYTGYVRADRLAPLSGDKELIDCERTERAGEDGSAEQQCKLAVLSRSPADAARASLTLAQVLMKDRYLRKSAPAWLVAAFQLDDGRLRDEIESAVASVCGALYGGADVDAGPSGHHRFMLASWPWADRQANVRAAPSIKSERISSFRCGECILVGDPVKDTSGSDEEWFPVDVRLNGEAKNGYINEKVVGPK